jgi:hypothetical protein
MKKAKVKSMSHEERMTLINRPIPTVHTYGGRVWGGVDVMKLRDIAFDRMTAERDWSEYVYTRED